MDITINACEVIYPTGNSLILEHKPIPDRILVFELNNEDMVREKIPNDMYTVSCMQSCWPYRSELIFNKRYNLSLKKFVCYYEYLFEDNHSSFLLKQTFKPQICTQCGAPLNGNRCDYCGTKFN
jgi:ribosomal protein L40E